VTATTLNLPSLGVVLEHRGRHVRYRRACDRCAVVREVRNPQAKRNLCRDCTAVLSRAEAARWAA
jgi:hypothetical protein